MPMRKGHEEEKEEKEFSELSDEEKWHIQKWLPNYPCRVVNASGDVINRESCPMDLQCNVGPVSYNNGNQTVQLSMCGLPGKFTMFHACKVTKGGKVIKEVDRCEKSGFKCDIGPVPVESEGEMYVAHFCSAWARGKPEGLRKMEKQTVLNFMACRVEDEQGNDLIRRPCPDTMSCTKGPQENEFNGRKVTVNLCEDEEPEWEWTLEETIQMLMEKKGIPARLILVVMNNMVEKGYQVDAKKVAEYAMKKAKEMMEGKMGDEEEEEDHDHGMGNKGQNGGMAGQKDPKIMEIMHKLHHQHLMEMEMKMRMGGQMGMDDRMGGMRDMLEGMKGRMEGMGDRMEGKKDDMQEMLQMVMRQAEMKKKMAAEKKEDLMEFMKKMVMMKGMMEQVKPDNDMEDLKKLVMLMTLMGNQEEEERDGGLIKKVMEMMKEKKGEKMGEKKENKRMGGNATADSAPKDSKPGAGAAKKEKVRKTPKGRKKGKR